MAAAPHRLNLTVQRVCAADLRAQIPERTLLRQWVKAACTEAATITLRFVDATESQQLNATYRGKDQPTNVLSFPYEREPLSGDLVFCPEVILAEAAAQGKTVTAHTAHMVVHGVLHLMGFDHLNDADAERMEAREITILADLGFANPYL